jgi:hypothetical protein
MKFVSKKMLQSIAKQNPDMIWYCGPIRELAEFNLPPGTVAVCYQMLDEAVVGKQVLVQCGSYFAVAPKMDTQTAVAWLKTNMTEFDFAKVCERCGNEQTTFGCFDGCAAPDTVLDK